MVTSYGQAIKKAPLTTAVKSALNSVIRWKFR